MKLSASLMFLSVRCVVQMETSAMTVDYFIAYACAIVRSDVKILAFLTSLLSRDVVHKIESATTINHCHHRSVQNHVKCTLVLCLCPLWLSAARCFGFTISSPWLYTTRPRTCDQWKSEVLIYSDANVCKITGRQRRWTSFSTWVRSDNKLCSKRHEGDSLHLIYHSSLLWP